MKPPHGAPSLAFCGRAGSGKTTAALFLEDTQGYVRASFAGKLKALSQELFGTDYGSQREPLQKLGAVCREIYPDVWVEALCRQLDEDDGSTFVVDDCRYPNEAAVLLSRGFKLVRVVCESYDSRVARLTRNGKWTGHEAMKHHSETSMDDYPVDYEVENNGDVLYLYGQLATILRKELR